MELTETEQQRRERIVGLILSAKSLMEIAAARQMLQDWIAAYPTDFGITDGFDHLAMSRSIAESQEVHKRAA